MLKAKDYTVWQRCTDLRNVGRLWKPAGHRATFTGRVAAWLARLLWEQEVPGSNPGVPTHRSDQGFCVSLRAAGTSTALSVAPAVGALLQAMDKP